MAWLTMIIGNLACCKIGTKSLLEAMTTYQWLHPKNPTSWNCNWNTCNTEKDAMRWWMPSYTSEICARVEFGYLCLQLPILKQALPGEMSINLSGAIHHLENLTFSSQSCWCHHPSNQHYYDISQSLLWSISHAANEQQHGSLHHYFIGWKGVSYIGYAWVHILYQWHL